MRWWPDTITRRDHRAIVDILTDQLEKSQARETALREMAESLTFATVHAARQGSPTAPMVRKGPDAVKVAILEKAGGDLKLARYLSEWVMKERAGGKRPDEELVTDILNWSAVDDASSDD